MNFQAIWLKVSSEFAPVFHAFNRKVEVEGQLKKQRLFLKASCRMLEVVFLKVCHAHDLLKPYFFVRKIWTTIQQKTCEKLQRSKLTCMLEYYIVYEIRLYRYLVMRCVFDLFECSYFVIHDTSHIVHDIEI